MASSNIKMSVVSSAATMLTVFATLAAAISFADAGEVEAPVSFVNDVMPVLTKAGCNAGICHAKAGGGQKGFHLFHMPSIAENDCQRTLVGLLTGFGGNVSKEDVEL